MSESKTPRTDAFRSLFSTDDIYHLNLHALWKTHADQLEHELNEAKAQATEFCKQWVESSAREAQLREVLGLFHWETGFECFPTNLDGTPNEKRLKVLSVLSTPPPPVVPAEQSEETVCCCRDRAHHDEQVKRGLCDVP